MARRNITNELKDYKDILFDILEANKVEAFEVLFDGSGDSGCVEHPDLDSKVMSQKVEGCKLSRGVTFVQGAKEEVFDNDVNVEKLIDHLCYELLEQHCGGWEINEGSYGTFYFNTNDRKITLDFHERVMEENVSEVTF